MQKKWNLLFVALLALSLVFCLGTVTWADDGPVEAVFEDVPAGHWAYEFIMDIFERGITTGTSTNPMLFSPDDFLTRAQFVTFLWRLADVDVTDYTDTPTPFKDINPAANMTWAYAYICWAAETGVTTGTGDGTVFDPQGRLTREQMATMVKRFADYYDIELEGIDEGAYITDWGSINDWAEDGIMALTPVYMSVENRLFRPKDDATRAEMAQVLSLFPMPLDDDMEDDDDVEGDEESTDK